MSFSSKLRKKRKKNDIKEIENVKKVPPQSLELMQLIAITLIKKKKTKVVLTGDHVILVRSSVITIKNWVTISINV